MAEEKTEALIKNLGAPQLDPGFKAQIRLLKELAEFPEMLKNTKSLEEIKRG